MVESSRGGTTMKLWADAEKTQPLETISFGKVEAGKSKTITVYLENDSKAVLTNLQYEFPNLPPSEVLLVEGPVTVQPGEIVPLKLTWKPSLSFRQSLKLDLVIKGEEVYLSEEEILIEKTLK